MTETKIITKWTPAMKRKARQELLGIANNYEVKPRKVLKNVRFCDDGTAKWIGDAHDYSVHIDQMKMVFSPPNKPYSPPVEVA